MIRPGQSDTENLRPAVFFDRDGTLIDDIGYLADPDGVKFYPGIPEALEKLGRRGYLIVVITNQSGIGRGYFNEETALAVNLSMLRRLQAHDVEVAAVYYCPHHPDDLCDCRKPGTVMIRRALDELGIEAGGSWVVGDIDKDIRTAIDAGLKPVLVRTGKTEKGVIPADVAKVPTVVEAIDHILREESR